MFLKSLEAQGFKSFPDKTVLTFEQGITGVVGPNGSGKSNISDAIRWVLGEQSNKQLRGEKMEDVIFNGTATRKPQGMASVTLCLDNTDRALPCDTDEVLITRRYYRSGESEYQINRATVRLKDVNELFMDTGLGRDGYSMIGQGKISDIVSRRSDERRDMFEEAAGISRYRYRKQEAERKLKATEDNLVRLRDIMAELEERVGPLANQSKKAKQFLEYAAEEKNLEIGLWLRSLERFGERLREQTDKMDLAQAQYEELERNIEKLQQKSETDGNQARLLTVQMDAARRSVAGMEEEAARLDGQAAVAENTIFHNQENIARVEGEIAASADNRADWEREMQVQQEIMAQKEEAIGAKNQMLAQATTQLEQLIGQAEDVNRRIEEQNREITRLSEEIAGSQLQSVTAVSSANEINHRGDAVEEAFAQRKAQLEAYETECEALKQDLIRCDEKIAECENILKGNAMLLTAGETKVAELKAKADELTLEAQTKKRRASLLEDMENSLEGFNNTVRRVSKEGASGVLGGILGPVSRLIKVKEIYATAIEVALGGAVQHVVTATEQDAKRAIAFLKKEKAGRATFLPLNTVKPREFNEKGLSDCAGYVGMADTLVDCDSRYRDIMSSLLGAIVVAEDLDSATAIGNRYGYRFRVVSLDGQVVNTGGSLTGGSFNRATGLLSRKGEIDAIKEQAAKLEAKAAACMNDYREAVAALENRKAEMEATRSEMATANEDKIRVLSEAKRNQEQIADAKETLDSLLNEQNEAAKRLEQLRKQATDAENLVAVLQQQLTEAQTVREQLVSEQEQLVHTRETLTGQNATVRLEIMALEKEKEAAAALQESAVKQTEDASGHRAALEEQLNLLRTANDLQAQRKEELLAQAAQLRQKAAEQEQLIAQKMEERTALETAVSAATAQERDLTLKRENLSAELVRLEERKDAMTAERDQIVTKLYDKYELTRNGAEQLGIVIEDPAAAGKRLQELKGKIRALGSVNVAAIEEYEQVSERYEFMSAQIGDVEAAKKELEQLINQLTGSMQTAFIEKFNQINGHFSGTFVELFGGGTAQLILTEPLDVLNSGIDIKVQPPGKNVASIEQLSGGEKSIVALAIYFAMMKVAPPPFCMLDEVESALDDVNVDRFATYLRRMSDRSQFIVVTHRRGTMEEADILYGVTMQEKGVSKLLKMNLKEADKMLSKG
ncbi:MAG: chromosome segregation protein SMC [Clostridia bacterium]|nr:chromosome segregation protein SMC [Clostridia bacterium]